MNIISHKSAASKVLLVEQRQCSVRGKKMYVISGEGEKTLGGLYMWVQPIETKKPEQL